MGTSWNYDTIKALAADTPGTRVTDLLALARQNDPFYVGTPADETQARWFADVWQRAGYSSGVHLRRVHYWCVSQEGLTLPDGKPYENTDKNWKFLTQASKMARYLGFVAIQDIVDRKNPDPHVSAVYNWHNWDAPLFEVHTPDLDDPYVWTHGFEKANAQPYHLEVWCEKSTMDDVLLPVCQRHSANLVTFEGEASITAVCVNLIDRIQASKGKPTRIFYISDFDPAGNSMPVATARKVEWSLRTLGLPYDVKLAPLALTLEQVQKHRLPRTPIKDSERRAARFEDAFGVGAVELDALEALRPGELARLVTDALAPYYSQEAAQQVYRQEQALQAAVKEQIEAITARYRAEIEALQMMIAELSAITIDTSAFKPVIGKPNAPEVADWLFDSERPYLEQIGHYKAHKNGKAAA